MGSCSEWAGGDLVSVYIFPGLVLKGCELLEVKARPEVLLRLVTIIY